MSKVLIAGFVGMVLSAGFTFSVALSNNEHDALYPLHRAGFHPAAISVVNVAGEEVGLFYARICGGGGAGAGLDRVRDYLKGLI